MSSDIHVLDSTSTIVFDLDRHLWKVSQWWACPFIGIVYIVTT